MPKETRKTLEWLISRMANELDDDLLDALRRHFQSSGRSEGNDSDTLRERLRLILEAADKIGEVDPEFDLKSFLDAHWES